MTRVKVVTLSQDSFTCKNERVLSAGFCTQTFLHIQGYADNVYKIR